MPADNRRHSEWAEFCFMQAIKMAAADREARASVREKPSDRRLLGERVPSLTGELIVSCPSLPPHPTPRWENAKGGR
jgi:hypothetical protein